MGATSNFLLKTGTDTPSGSLGLTYGDESLYRLDGFYGFPIGGDWFGSVGGFFRQSDGVRDPEYTADEGGQFTAFLPAGITVAGMNMIAMHGVLSQPAAWRAISDPLAAQVGGVAVDQEIARRIDGGWWLKPGEFVTVSANAVNIAVQPLGVNVELTFARVPI